MAAAGSFDNDTVLKLRKDLNGALSDSLKKSLAELDSTHQELQMISGLYDKGAVSPSNSEQVGVIAQDAVNEAKSVIADGFKLMTAFVRYASGTNAIVKRAEIEAELNALDTSSSGDSDMTSEHNTNPDSDLMSLINDSDSNMINALLADDMGSSSSESNDLDSGSSSKPSDSNEATVEVKPGEVVPTNLPSGVPVSVKKDASLSTKEGRAALRAKLAADATGKEETGEIQDMSKQKFSDMLDQADNLADGQTQLDVKPSDSLGLIETLPEQNKAMMEVAKAPPKVLKEAESIQRLVSQGKLDLADINSLVAQGELDKDAVAYWKKYYGQVEGGGEFASELVKEHAKAELEAELNKFRIKLARAYELTYDMIDRGLCGHDKSSINDQVDRVMKMNDEGFDSYKRVVAKSAPIFRKEAGRMPQVGVNYNENPPEVASADGGNLREQLEAAFATSTRRMF
jgi:hypothetical protein